MVDLVGLTYEGSLVMTFFDTIMDVLSQLLEFMEVLATIISMFTTLFSS